MDINDWRKVEVDVSQELSFNVGEFFGVDIIINGESSTSVHLENYSGNVLEFNLLWPRSNFEETQSIVVVKPGFFDHKSIPNTMKEIVFFWRIVN